MSKRLFLLVLALVIVVIAGAVGGAIGGVMAGKDKKTSNHPASGNGSTSTAANATSTPVSSASVTGTSGNLAAFATLTNIATMLDISKSIGSLGASTLQGPDGGVNIHLFYQQGANIAYRVYPGSGYFTLPRSLPFSMEPKPGTPLSTVEVSSSENTNCVSVLQELVIDNTGWHNGEVLPVAAIAGSPLSVTITKVESPTSRLVVFYVDDKTRTLFSVTYYIEWKPGVALSTTALYAWTTNTALASITQTNSVYIRAYYIGSDKEIYEMLDPGAGTVWSTDTDRDPNWPKADFSAAGGLVGIGWDDQVRVYYVSGGVVKQLSLSGGNWHVLDGLGQ
ncbi:uncharacterized protein RSE6_14148 [Rhynchosporium secalis]|uniref:Uncharacterized protein n=1 Tax=Rhynchosporium secalis TaxID=38038 RepID=A0A1E1MUL8_RHYSE|nr:uncharacterized protein RSE6_14148 [Rhynchosporium secalis]